MLPLSVRETDGGYSFMRVWTQYFGTAEKLLLLSLSILIAIFLWQLGHQASAQPITESGNTTMAGFHSPMTASSNHVYQKHLKKAAVDIKEKSSTTSSTPTSTHAESTNISSTTTKRSNTKSNQEPARHAIACSSATAVHCLRLLTNI